MGGARALDGYVCGWVGGALVPYFRLFLAIFEDGLIWALLEWPAMSPGCGLTLHAPASCDAGYMWQGLGASWRQASFPYPYEPGPKEAPPCFYFLHQSPVFYFLHQLVGTLPPPPPLPHALCQRRCC